MPNWKRVSTIRHLSIPEAAYLAGIIDGEGHIKRMKRSPSTVQIAIGTTSKDLIVFLLGVGGRQNTYHPSPTHLGKKDMYLWNLSTQVDVYNLLTQVAPFMIIKKIEVDDALRVLQAKSYKWKEG